MAKLHEPNEFKSVGHNLLSCYGILMAVLARNTISVTVVVVLRETLKPGPSEQESSGVQAVFRSLVGYL
jgi:hypothetical protein